MVSFTCALDENGLEAVEFYLDDIEFTDENGDEPDQETYLDLCTKYQELMEECANDRAEWDYYSGRDVYREATTERGV